MPVFEYSAFDQKGRKSQGIIEADSRPMALARLREKALMPARVMKLETRQSAGVRLLGRVFSRVKAADVVLITRLLSTLLSAGFPLVRAVAAVADQSGSRALHRAMSGIKDALEQGSSLSKALALYPGIFSSVYVNMVAAGESSGTLELVLARLADFAEKGEETRKKIWAALAYPMVMSVIGFLVLVILMTHIVPGIVDIFADMNQTLPLPTRILIRTSEFFTVWWWAVILAPCLGMAAVLGARKTPRGLEVTDRLVLSAPGISHLVRKLIAARFSRTLASLLANGVPMLTALTITKNVAGNRIIANIIRDAALAVEKGGQLGGALAQAPYIPTLMIRMIRVGEKSGEMETMLDKAADLYEKDVETAVTAATALIEPLIILVMGAVVGLIIMSVCLPIVEINQFVN